MSFTEKDYSEILGEFEKLSDEEYRQFSASLIPTGTELRYGVRIPKIRAIAKGICKDDPIGFLKVCKDDSYEEITLQAVVIPSMKAPIDEKIYYLERFIPKIDNWSVCDTLCTTFKPKDNEKKALFDFAKSYLFLDEEYSVRFGVVTLLASFIDEEHIDEILTLLPKIKHDAYYVKMAIAWNISVCFVKFRNKTLELLKKQEFDEFTQNKSIQKIRESYRVEKADKDMLLKYKIKS